jgi:hypothetical protein
VVCISPRGGCGGQGDAAHEQTEHSGQKRRATLRSSQAAAEPAQERDWCGGGVSAGGGVVAAVGDGGGAHEAVVVGGSVQVGDVLLGDDEGELGMHGWTWCWDVVRAL